MENYKEIKNYLHNDLGITKEYVDSIIIKTVQDEVKKIFNNEQYIRDTIQGIIWQEVNTEFVGKGSFHTIHDMTNIIKDDINNIICEEVKKRLIIKLEDNNEKS